MLASLSMLVCRVLSFAILVAASLSISLSCRILSLASHVAASLSIKACRFDLAIVLFAISLFKSVLNNSVGDVNELLIAMILEALSAISVPSSSISLAWRVVVVCSVFILLA